MGAVHDVVIVGAGPGGSAAAYYLARRGLDVLLVDKAGFPRDKICGDGLTPKAVSVLDDMGVLFDSLLAVGRRIDGVEIVAPDGYPTSTPLPPRNGLPSSVLVVPRLALDDAIRRRALSSGARFAGQIGVSGVEATSSGVVVTGARGRYPVAFTARIAILATGASLSLLHRLGLLPDAPPMMLAARAYFEGLGDLAGRIQIRFDGVPLPGYGWIFPLSGASANVGVGFFPHARRTRRPSTTPRAAFDRFTRSGAVGAMLAQARRCGPARSYPLRVDFPACRTSGDRILLVGEAAGLVNPLTGEGIDYALESAQIAAQHVASLLETGDLSPQSVAGYDRLLRDRFERLFAFCRRVRDLALHPLILNRLIRVADRREDLKMALADIVLGNRPASTAHAIGGPLTQVISLGR